jgi:methyl-accepting chemotaxis protein
MTTAPSPEEQLLEVRKGADRMLSLLLVLHLPAAFGLAVLHGTWIAALLVGGGVSAGAYLLAQRAPGEFATRAFIGVGLVAYSALFVHQTQGLIEMHFHFFGVLAFLLVYRDWRVRRARSPSTTSASWCSRTPACPCGSCPTATSASAW